MLLVAKKSCETAWPLQPVGIACETSAMIGSSDLAWLYVIVFMFGKSLLMMAYEPLWGGLGSLGDSRRKTTESLETPDIVNGPFSEPRLNSMCCVDSMRRFSSRMLRHVSP